MGKLNELKTTQEIVMEILEKHPFTRSSDMKLYAKVCEALNPEALNKPFSSVILSLKEFKLPAFETVRRARQKLQAAYPELCGAESVEEQRLINEIAFKDYAVDLSV